MKFNTRTLKILQNFSMINPSLMFKQGDILSTRSPTKTIYALANLDQNIEFDFGIFDITKFINTLSMFDEYTIDFEKNYLQINQQPEGMVVKYVYASEELLQETLKGAPTKKIKLPNEEIKCKITQNNMTKATKALDILGLKQLSICGKNGTIYLQATDPKNPSSDNFEIAIGDTDKDFLINFNPDNLKLLPMDYNVTICKPKDGSSSQVAQFEGEYITYWVTFESNYKFN